LLCALLLGIGRRDFARVRRDRAFAAARNVWSKIGGASLRRGRRRAFGAGCDASAVVSVRCGCRGSDRSRSDGCSSGRGSHGGGGSHSSRVAGGCGCRCACRGSNLRVCCDVRDGVPSSHLARLQIERRAIVFEVLRLQAGDRAAAAAAAAEVAAAAAEVRQRAQYHTHACSSGSVRVSRTISATSPSLAFG